MTGNNSIKNITEEMLADLRVKVGKNMTQKRYLHTLEVEKMASAISDLYCPDRKNILRAAALLHDITKAYDTEKHVELLKKYHVKFDREEIFSPKTLHEKTAALLIPQLYPDFADKIVINAVRYHTTGRAFMSLEEKIVYLADYIDETRKFDDCVKLRELFWGANPEKMNLTERLEHLDKIMLISFDMTIKGLIEEGQIINKETTEARNQLILRLKKTTEGGFSDG